MKLKYFYSFINEQVQILKVASNLGRGLNLRRILKDQNVDMSSEQILNILKNLESWNGNFKAFYEM